MNNDWTVDLANLKATHSSGFSLQVEGNPKDPHALHPGKFPPELSSIEQVRLLRTGVEAIAAEAKKARPQGRPEKVRTVVKKPSLNSASKSDRPTLSLKKTVKTSAESSESQDS